MFLKDNLNEHEQIHYINYLLLEIRSAVFFISLGVNYYQWDLRSRVQS